MQKLIHEHKMLNNDEPEANNSSYGINISKLFSCIADSTFYEGRVVKQGGYFLLLMKMFRLKHSSELTIYELTS